jgi:microcin C transport system permease protein
LGIAKAVRAGTRFDTLTSLVVLIGYAIPGFVLGVALLVVFGGQLQWFPLRGLTSGNWETLSWGAKVVDYLWHIALPVTASVLGAFAVTTMLTKNAFLEEIGKQYVLTARAKGLGRRDAAMRHALRNAFLPVLSYLGPATAFAVTGSFVVEKVFAVPGIGQNFVDGVLGKDITLVMGVVLVYSTLMVVFNLAVDVMYRFVDPRIA